MATYDWAVEAYWGKKGDEDEGIPARAAPSVFVVFDLETTGLEPKKERIVEIGAVKFDNRGPIGRFSVLIDPGMPMPAEASKINGITDEMLKGKPLLDDVLPDFLRFIEGTVLIAHNAPFDCSFVDAALSARYERPKRARQEDSAQGSLLGGNSDAETVVASAWIPPFPSLPNRVVDTRVLAKETFPGRWKYSLQELAKYFGINAEEAHRAEDDARVCMELFIKCVDNAAGKEVPVFSA